MYLPDRAANECDQLSMAGRATADGFKRCFVRRRPAKLSSNEPSRTRAVLLQSVGDRCAGWRSGGGRFSSKPAGLRSGDEAGPASVALALVQGARRIRLSVWPVILAINGTR